MKQKLIRFAQDERALGTLEILLIVAVLITLALVFRKYILNWFQTLLEHTDETMQLPKSDLSDLQDLEPIK